MCKNINFLVDFVFGILHTWLTLKTGKNMVKSGCYWRVHREGSLFVKWSRGVRWLTKNMF